MTNVRRVPRPKMLGGQVTWLNPGGIEYEETWYTMNLIYSVAGICGAIGLVFFLMTYKVLKDMGVYGDSWDKKLMEFGFKEGRLQRTADDIMKERRRMEEKLWRKRGYQAPPPYHEPSNGLATASSRWPLPDSAPRPGSDAPGRARGQRQAPPRGSKQPRTGPPQRPQQAGRGYPK